MYMPHVYAVCPYCMSLLLPVHAACPCRMFLLHVLASCPCFMSLLHVLAAIPCCMSMLHIRAAFRAAFRALCPCCISTLHVHLACPYGTAWTCCMFTRHFQRCLLMLHALLYVRAACLYCKFLPYVQCAFQSCMSKLHFRLLLDAACPCNMYIVHVHAVFPCCMSLLHFLPECRAACPDQCFILCSCCMHSKSKPACPCYISMRRSMLDIYTACPCSMS